jgi:alkanesulfonate monooxygenase SsuD/methylene tetrahydromethanopterin reductase-like flavin-dependent oxidoreductase (luciferase family)
MTTLDPAVDPAGDPALDAAGDPAARRTGAPPTRFGVHVGLQHTNPAELRPLYRHIEALGFDWISVWDHFYGATGQPDDAACLEAVAMHATLACETSRVRCGSLVYSIGYRHPAVLAKAITTIDLISGGRADMGIGAGWAEIEYRAYGMEFPPVAKRMDQLEEGIQVLRGLLHGEVTTFAGEWFQLEDARNEPRPVQARLPISSRRRVVRAVRVAGAVRAQARRAAPALCRRRP